VRELRFDIKRVFIEFEIESFEYAAHRSGDVDASFRN
jgi:hypothetical protein